MAPAEIYVFDCDGVIIDSGDDIADSVNHALTEFGYWPLPRDKIISFIGDGAESLLLRSLAASTKNNFNIGSDSRKKEFNRILSIYTEYYTTHPVVKTRLYAGIRELLRVLREKGKKNVLLTNKSEGIARVILEKLGVLPYFDLVIGPDTEDEKGRPVGRKPSVSGLEYALRSMNEKYAASYTNENMIMFGDSASDIRTGKSFGARTVACRGGLGNKEELLAEEADFCISVASEIEKFIDTLSKDGSSESAISSGMRDYAMRFEVPIIQDEGIDLICSLIRERGVRSVLEIGSAIGYSAIKFARLSPDIRVTTIEIDGERYGTALSNIARSGLGGQISVIHGDALAAEIEGEFDLIFIDAAKSRYIKFFERFKANLSPGGVIVSDNLSFHGMVEDLSLTRNHSTRNLVKKIRKYIDFLKANEEFETVFLKKGDGISVSERK